MNATQTSVITGTLGALGEFLDVPGAGMLLGFALAWYCFHSICEKCRGSKKS